MFAAKPILHTSNDNGNLHKFMYMIFAIHLYKLAKVDVLFIFAQLVYAVSLSHEICIRSVYIALLWLH